MTGDARQQFMISCLSDKPAAETKKPQCVNGKPSGNSCIAKDWSATSEKAASSGETRRRVRIGLSARGRSKAKPDSILRNHGQHSVSALLGYVIPFVPEYRERRRVPLLNGFLLPHMTFHRIENRGHREYRKDKPTPNSDHRQELRRPASGETRSDF